MSRMDREMVLHNIMNNYSKYGITEDMINNIIDIGLEGGLSYEFIYFDICRMISEVTGEKFVCTSSDMAKAFGVSDEAMQKIIEEARQELIKAVKDPDKYFREVPVQRFML